MKKITTLLIFFAISIFAQTTITPPNNEIQNNTNLVNIENLQKNSLNNFSHINKSKLDNSYRIDSIHAHSGNINTHIYTYDENQKMVLDSAGYFSGNEWQKISKRTLTYNSNGNVSTHLIEYWNQGGYWRKSSLSEYKYIEVRVDSFKVKYWTNNSWENKFLTTYKYNTNGKVEESNFEMWSDTGWAKNSKETFTYNNDGKLSQKLIVTWLTPENIWHNSGLISYQYDANGNEIESLEKTWLSNTWSDNRKITSTYNANNQKTSWLEETFSNSLWANVKRVFYLYDDNNNINYAYHESWDNRNEAWNKKNGSIVFQDNSGSQFILFASEIDVFYNEITDISDNSILPKKYMLAQNYPNPFNPSTTIQFSIPKASMVSLKIYNTLGEEVATLINKEMGAGFQSINFDASNFTSGVYIYRLVSSNFTASKKLLLMK